MNPHPNLRQGIVLEMDVTHYDFGHWLTSKQVDCINASTQAGLKEVVCIEQPKGFNRKGRLNMVLNLINSVYGLKHAPTTFFKNWE